MLNDTLLNERTVTVNGVYAKEIQTYAPADALHPEPYIQTLGVAFQERYAGDKLTRYQFSPVGRAIEKHPINLGFSPTESESAGIPNPLDIQQFLISEGWIPVKHYLLRKGVGIDTFFIDPTMVWQDTLGDDLALWQTPDVTTWQAGTIRRAISVRVNLTLGRMAYTVTAGVYRLVCTNGLMHAVLEGGCAEITHQMIQKMSARDLLSKLKNDNVLTETTTMPTGRLLGSGKNVKPVAQIVRNIAKAKHNNDPLPYGNIEAAKAISGRSEWFLNTYADILDNIAERDQVYAIHVLNASTTVANKRGELTGRYTYDEYSAAKYITAPTCELITLAGAFVS